MKIYVCTSALIHTSSQTDATVLTIQYTTFPSLLKIRICQVVVGFLLDNGVEVWMLLLLLVEVLGLE